jgi:hypothetical protein
MPDLPRGNKYMPNPCIIGGGSGGGVLLDYWHERTSLFVGFVFGSTGKPLTFIFFEWDSKTTNWVVAKIRVDPNYLVVFFAVVNPTKKSIYQ